MEGTASKLAVFGQARETGSGAPGATGNLKTNFEAISTKYTGREVRLDGYGRAYVHVMNQVREQITRRQSHQMDPFKYPSSSYEIYLNPSSNLFNMFPLAMEVQRIESASPGSTVTFDVGNLLGVVEVGVRFNSSFRDFFPNSAPSTTTRVENEEKGSATGAPTSSAEDRVLVNPK